MLGAGVLPVRFRGIDSLTSSSRDRLGSWTFVCKSGSTASIDSSHRINTRIDAICVFSDVFARITIVSSPEAKLVEVTTRQVVHVVDTVLVAPQD